MEVVTGGRKSWCGLVGQFDSERERHRMQCYCRWLLFQSKKNKGKERLRKQKDYVFLC